MSNNPEKEKAIQAQTILAHKQLAETYVKNPEKVGLAIVHLQDVIKVAQD